MVRAGGCTLHDWVWGRRFLAWGRQPGGCIGESTGNVAATVALQNITAVSGMQERQAAELGRTGASVPGPQARW